MRANPIQFFILAAVSVGACSSGSDVNNSGMSNLGGGMEKPESMGTSGGASTKITRAAGGATLKATSDSQNAEGGASEASGGEQTGGASESGGADSAGGTAAVMSKSGTKTSAGSVGGKSSTSAGNGGTSANNTSASSGGKKAVGGTGPAGGTKAAGGTTATGTRGPCSPPLSYRNLFSELLSKGNTEVNTKLSSIFQSLFHSETNNVYYESGDGAYILDVAANDVRSEGNSYGMMIAVQMDRQAEFDAIWSWAKAHTRRSDGLFAWQTSPTGNILADYPAPDGDEYFATALIFASKRWGGDYASEAKSLLSAIQRREFNSSYNLVNFGPDAPSNGYTDASYMLPAFYEVWACFDTGNQSFWKTAASSARSFFQKNTNSSTGLAPDYAEFSGAARNGSNFGPDAWRVAMNIMMDHHFFGVDSWQTTYAARLAAFWTKEGESYGDKYTLTGSKLNENHGAGLTGMNAMLGFGLPAEDGKPFVQALWSQPLPTGDYRYYDGMLYLLAMLHVSGRFQLYY